jgi:hypothetical protein
MSMRYRSAFLTAAALTLAAAFARPASADKPADLPADPRVTCQSCPQDAPCPYMFGVGVNSNAGVVGSVVVNERNFDLIPDSMYFVPGAEPLMCSGYDGWSNDEVPDLLPEEEEAAGGRPRPCEQPPTRELLGISISVNGPQVFSFMPWACGCPKPYAQVVVPLDFSFPCFGRLMHGACQACTRSGETTAATTVPEQLDVMPAEDAEESEAQERTQHLLQDSMPLGLVESEWYRIYFTDSGEVQVPFIDSGEVQDANRSHDGPDTIQPDGAEKAPASTCPYLRQQASRKEQNQHAHASLQLDGKETLRVLEQLSKARHLYQRGEHYRRTGDVATAATYYEKAHLVCPDCRYGQQAIARIAEMEAAQAAPGAAVGAEEQEKSTPPDDPEVQSSADIPPCPQVAACIDGMLQECQAALDAGDLKKAKAIAHRACHLHESYVTAHPLQRRLRLLARLNDMTEAPAAPATTQATECIDGMLSECQEAIRCGDLAKAQNLVLLARGLDAQYVLAHPLVRKQHLLARLDEALAKAQAVAAGHGVAGSTEESEPPLPPDDEEQEHVAAPATQHTCPQVAASIDHMLAECQKALVRGELQKAQDLVLLARGLDPMYVDGHPLVCKMHLLTQLDAAVAKARALAEGPGAPGATEESEPPTPAEVDEFNLEMSPPPVDPGVVEALEQALNATADPLSPTVVVVEDEPPLAPGQEPETFEPISGWPYVAPETEFPSLLEQPFEDERATEEEEPPATEPVAGPNRDLGELLREAIAAIRGGACVDIDASRLGNLRAQVELQVGGVDLKMAYDNAGHCYMVFHLQPEGVRDLQTAQRLHNETMLQWIENVSGNGHPETPEEFFPLPEEDAWFDDEATDSDSGSREGGAQ